MIIFFISFVIVLRIRMPEKCFLLNHPPTSAMMEVGKKIKNSLLYNSHSLLASRSPQKGFLLFEEVISSGIKKDSPTHTVWLSFLQENMQGLNFIYKL